MIFIILILMIAVVSVLLALYSLKKELQKHVEIEDAKKDIAKGRVVYHSSDVKRV